MSIEHVQQLESIANYAKATLAAAVAKIRIETRGEPAPPLAKCPRQLEITLEELRKDGAGQSMVDQVHNLICATIAEVDESYYPTLSWGTNIRFVEISWEGREAGHNWVVRHSDMNWPAIHVEVFVAEADGRIRAQTFWSYSTLLECFKSFVKHD